MVRALLAFRAEEQAGNPAEASASDDEEIGIPRFLHEDVRCFPFDDFSCEFDVPAFDRIEGCVEDVLRFFL